MSNGDGLKKQWGVGDPAKAGSDKQAQQFQASFQKEMGGINGHLQYTAVNAVQADHDVLAFRRDGLYAAFQGANAQIDRTNPAKAQGAIDKVLADSKAVCDQAAALHMAAEKALNDWKARLPKYDTAVHQIEELEAWGDEKAPALRAVIDTIRTQTNQRQYAQASTALDQLLPKLKPIYDEYLKQKAAMPIAEQMGSEESARLEALKGAEKPSKPMVTKSDEINTELNNAHEKGAVKDYVASVEILKKVKTDNDALEKMTKDPERVKFLADRPGIETLFNDATGDATQFTSLADRGTAIGDLHEKLDPTAESGDYAGANKMIADLKKKCDELKKKAAELKKQKDEYMAALVPLDPQIQEALKCTYASLKPKVDEIAKANQAQSAAAEKEDYAAALKSLNDLKAKVDALLPEIKKLQKAEEDYNKEHTSLQPKLDDALVSARNFESLKSARDAIVAGQSAVEAAATANDFEKALQLAKDLGPKVDAYLKDAKTEEDKYRKKGDEITKKLDDAGYLDRDDVARELVHRLKPDELDHLPPDVRNRLLQELQSGDVSDEDKAACKKLYSVATMDPAFEALDGAHRKAMIEKLKSDPAFKAARQNWEHMSPEERVAVMKKAADIQSEVYGLPETKVEAYSKDFPPEDYGYFKREDGILHVNTSDDAMKENAEKGTGGFDEAMDTATHENEHRYQAMLIDKLNSGDIKPGDPLYNQAMAFKLNDPEDGFSVKPKRERSSPDRGDEYRTQPKEHHARVTGEAVRAAGLGK